MKIARWKKFVSDTRGANMVEYIILVGVIAILALGGFRVFGSNVTSVISAQAGQVSTINTSTQ